MTTFEILAISAAMDMVSEWYDKGGKTDAELICEYYRGHFTLEQVEEVLNLD